MVMLFLLAVIVLFVLFAGLLLALSISKTINGIFFGFCPWLFWIVKTIAIVKNIVLVTIIYKLCKKDKAEK